MIREISIKNYKSILDHAIELGRINVFIGENGSGKTNILEAAATASAAIEDKLGIEELYARGVRIARPATTISSFLQLQPAQAIEIGLGLADKTESKATWSLKLGLSPEDSDDIHAGWRVAGLRDPSLLAIQAKEWDARTMRRFADYLRRRHVWAAKTRDLCIYNLNPLALRGIEVVSRRVPLGIHGENLDVFIAGFDKKRLDKLLEHARVVSWLDRLVLDTEDELKFQGHKLGRSISRLYFRDRFMRRKNNVLSAENANEGILHILFYLALFLSDKTPPFFGIDNIETALNPQLCRDLMKTIATLAKEQDKQALITTHNPAILDGLNLHDDEQRLFVVYRNDRGHTETKRIKLKPDTGESKYKLSELWMRGHLGGLPKTF
jgi:predicted ATPase